MSLRHHPSDDLLLEHAAGALESGRDLVVLTHLRACADCRRKVAVDEAVGGALLAELAPTPLGEDALALALARIERPARPAPPAPTPIVGWIDTPSPVLAAAWRRRRWAAPGVWVAPVGRASGSARTYLLRVAAGMAVPLHTHTGHETVCVLKGAYVDRGLTHRAGDFAHNDDSVIHTPAATEEDECVCLIAADAALIPKDWVGRMFQPFVGI